MPLTREQERAKLAHQQVSAVQRMTQKEQRKYRTITRKAQALIRNAGLCQALHFIESKEEFRPLKNDLQAHLAKHTGMRGDILEAVRSMPLSEYLAATREVLQCLTWQCRMVDALLGEGDDD